ncbi:MAG: SMP-30/gluconolactonase/LRE family protein [Anaerolineae bacterium]|nr:SMP-30/gluconolactonase/LRE family protein [Anaerolineae bacterium]MDW8173730.1 SMP-30/gluconolactonase/LRE family protein [Anaerolineae bacterium]
MPNLDIRDERLLHLVDPQSPLERLLTGFKFTEGPVWHSLERHLRFSDILGNSIYQWSAAEGLRDIRPNSHMANGNAYDRQWRLLTCHHATSCVTRTEADGRVVVLASHYRGRQLNSPNDIVVKRDGTIYFTDPMSGREPFVGIPRPSELGFCGVYRLEAESGELTLLVDDFVKPNGLCFSPDERLLFVNDTARAHIRVFEVRDDGSLANGRLWAELSGDGVGVADGMKIDQGGFLLCCGPGGIHVFDQNAVCLGRILIPEQTTNFTWGDDDLRTLYITAATSVYRLRLKPVQ